MSTREYLERLNLDQLRKAKEITEELIKKQVEEGYVTLWVVCDEDINYEFYTLENYQRGVEKMVSLMIEEAKKNPNEEMSFSIQKQRFPLKEAQRIATI